MKRISKDGLSHGDWLKLRQTMIGGSDIAAVLGVSKYKTPLELYLEKIAQSPIELPDSDALWFGKALEPVIAQRWTEERNLPTQNVNAVLLHDSIAYMGADIDRRIVSTPRGPGVLEIKTTNPFTYKQWAEHGVSLDHMAQIQWYLWITGYEWGSFAILVGGQKFYSLDVTRNDQLIGVVADRVRQFWESNILQRVPPDPINTSDTATLYSTATAKKVMVVVPERYEQVRRLQQVKTQLVQLEAEFESLSTAVQDEMKDVEVLQDANGNKLISWTNRAGYKRFDSKAFQSDHADLYKQYKTQEVKSSRTFTVKPISEEDE